MKKIARNSQFDVDRKSFNSCAKTPQFMQLNWNREIYLRKNESTACCRVKCKCRKIPTRKRFPFHIKFTVWRAFVDLQIYCLLPKREITLHFNAAQIGDTSKEFRIGDEKMFWQKKKKQTERKPFAFELKKCGCLQIVSVGESQKALNECQSEEKWLNWYSKGERHFFFFFWTLANTVCVWRQWSKPKHPQ